MAEIPSIEMHPHLDVLHLSVRNAVDHPRMTLRLAASQAAAGWRVGVVGLEAPEAALPPGVQALDLPAPTSGGLLARWGHLRRVASIIRQYALRVRPRLLVLHTPELAELALELQRRLGCALWYDAHEDYMANARYSSAYPTWQRALRAFAAARAEQRLRPALAAASYAERCYGNRLGLPHGCWLTLENLFAPPATVTPAPPIGPEPLLLTCGTLADDWGLWSSLQLWSALNQTRPVHWAVVGQGAPLTLARLTAEVQRLGLTQRFTGVMSTRPVAYATVVGWLQRATALTALYRPTAAIAERVPTKVFEAVAHRLPVLLTAGGPGAPLNARWRFAVELETPWRWADDAVACRAAAARVRATLEAGFAGLYPEPVPPAVWQWSAEAGPALVALTERVIGAPEAS